MGKVRQSLTPGNRCAVVEALADCQISAHFVIGSGRFSS